jgi:hypothetical protein
MHLCLSFGSGLASDLTTLIMIMVVHPTLVSPKLPPLILSLSLYIYIYFLPFCLHTLAYIGPASIL